MYTIQEKMILSLVARGFSTREIAQVLSMDVHTVSLQRRKLLLKLQGKES